MAEATVRIAVCDAASSYRHGLGSALTAGGYVVNEAEHVGEQALLTDVDAVLSTVRSANE